MSETKFTRRPWVAVQGQDNEGQTDAAIWGTILGRGIHLARVWNDIGDDDGTAGPHAEAAANAVLIAAAPDLYEALEYLEHAARSVDVGYLDGAVERARAALARARGEA